MIRSFVGWLWISLVISASACAASRPSRPDAPDASRIVPTSAVGPWTFSHSSGSKAYRISRTASVQDITDSSVRREVVSNFTHEVLTFEPAGEEIGFRAVVDTFTSTTEGSVGPPQLVELPLQLSGAVTPTGIRIEYPANTVCNAIRATVTTDLHNLITPFPVQLSKGARWRDSTAVTACQAGIPTTTTTSRIFTASGEVMHSGRSYILVQRADSIIAHGDGAYNQHRMLIEGAGVGSALYYLDIVSGEISRLTTSQSTQIRVTTSGRVHSFTQTANQDFLLVH